MCGIVLIFVQIRLIAVNLANLEEHDEPFELCRLLWSSSRTPEDSIEEI